jgi:hypothetical protein
VRFGLPVSCTFTYAHVLRQDCDNAIAQKTAALLLQQQSHQHNALVTIPSGHLKC